MGEALSLGCGPELQKFWRELKQQDQKNVSTLKNLIGQEIDKNCF